MKFLYWNLKFPFTTQHTRDLQKFPHFYIFAGNSEGGSSGRVWECHVTSQSGKPADLAV